MGRTAVFGLAFVVLLCARSLVACSHDEEAADANSASVQSSALERHFTVATTALQGPLADAQRATGALLVPRRSPTGDDTIVMAQDGTPIRSSCGVTFIDRTHAITAAHCVDPIDIPDITTRSVSVELYDINPGLDWRKAATVTGSFPNYKHASLDGVAGYDITRMTCYVTARCGYGSEHCPEPALTDSADIALLTCTSELPADRQPVTIASVDDEHGPVRAFWFHEVYDAPTAPPNGSRGDKAGEQSLNLYFHYTVSDPTGQQNFHYFDNGRNNLLPLISSDWLNGRMPTSRRALGRDGTVVWTDLFGCHGTSGSGVMQIDATSTHYLYLGPVATASRDWGGTRLCADLQSHTIGRPSLSYTALAYTKAMAALITTAALSPTSTSPPPESPSEPASNGGADEDAAAPPEPAPPANEDPDAGM